MKQTNNDNSLPLTIKPWPYCHPFDFPKPRELLQRVRWHAAYTSLENCVDDFVIFCELELDYFDYSLQGWEDQDLVLSAVYELLKNVFYQ
jgi:hypothetical protein